MRTRVIATVALTLSLAVLGANAVAAPVFTKIADSTTPIPGGSGTFSTFNAGTSTTTPDPPAIDKGLIVFSGRNASLTSLGVYSFSGGQFSAVADRNTLLPGSAALLQGAGNAKVSVLADGRKNISFLAGPSRAGRGIFRSLDGAIELIADGQTQSPVTGALFNSLNAPVTDGTAVVFSQDATNSAHGVYRFDNGVISTIVRPGDPGPDGPIRFTFSQFGPSPVAGAGAVVFQATVSNKGVYRKDQQGVTAIADEFTQVPGAPPGKTFLSYPNYDGFAFDGKNVVFLAERSGPPFDLLGIYRFNGTSLECIIDETMSAPGSPFFHFTNLTGVSVDGDLVAFTGYSDSLGTQDALWASMDGRVQKIIGNNQMLFGKRVSRLDISSEATDGDRIVFWAGFTDQSSGIFVATVPEPGGLVLGTVVAIMRLCGRRRRAGAPTETRTQRMGLPGPPR